MLTTGCRTNTGSLVKTYYRRIEEMRAPTHCWVHHAIDVRTSPIAGKGLFSKESIPAGTIVMRLGGQVITRSELKLLFNEAANRSDSPYIDCISIEDGIDLVLEGGEIVHYGNHSCDPNIWHVGPFELATIRDVAAGEEIALDYGTQADDSHFEMDCHCRAMNCRGKVTGIDWKLPKLQVRYGSHWVPVLLKRIALLNHP
jgi:hypothetical protein